MGTPHKCHTFPLILCILFRQSTISKSTLSQNKISFSVIHKHSKILLNRSVDFDNVIFNEKMASINYEWHLVGVRSFS